MIFLATLKEEILSREQEAYGILFDQLYSERQIASLCRQADVILRNKEKTEQLSVPLRAGKFSDFVTQVLSGIPFADVFNSYNADRKAGGKFTADEFYAVTFYATLAAVHFRNLQKLLPPPGQELDDPPQGIVEFMAKIALDVSIATLCLTEAGWKPTEAIANNYREGQRSKASKKRRPEINQMLATLAARPHFHWPVKQLWYEFISMLDAAQMDPQDTGNRKNTKTWKVQYTTDKGTFSYNFSSFKTRISSIRGEAAKKLLP